MTPAPKSGVLARIFAGLVTFLKDLFYGNGNKYAELGRILVFVCVSLQGAAGAWNAYLGQSIDLMAFGTGLAAILTAGIGAAAVKDWVAAKAISQATRDASATDVSDAVVEKIEAETDALPTTKGAKT